MLNILKYEQYLKARIIICIVFQVNSVPRGFTGVNFDPDSLFWRIKTAALFEQHKVNQYILSVQYRGKKNFFLNLVW